MGRAQWFTSSHSNGAGECVEVADAGDGVLTRDSKQRPGPVLVSSAEGWQAFIAGVVRGDLAGTE
ncbi:DUF397 domain-containing protein [Streptomyces marincola]|uniref:DUF397 domain-containing protein n=1 Tax=Streptomyces marincola TaxID=2878388 RepID=A0A1W7D641_9ACTN|nr:DUF397 domain-containing protein [Streptomyces marincola]ARQ72379.1 DUF397 domain-containing protein [Streptomyces marincola]